MTPRVAAALVMATAGVARAGDLSGRATAGYNQVHSDEQDTDTFAQVYDLRFERAVSSLIQYRLALRAQDDLGTALISGERHDYENRELRPVANLQWTTPSLGVQLGYDLTWTQARTEGVTHPSRLLQHAQLAAIANPSADLRLTTDLQWRLVRSGQDLDTSEVRGAALAAWKKRTLAISGGGTTAVYQDPVHDLSRVVVGALGATTWSDSFDGGKVSVTLGNTALWNLQRESSRSGATVEQARRELPAAALHAIDQTPLDSRDAPLVAVPALLDGDLATATAIDLGPTGADYQALGVDMGRFVEFDELRIDVRSQGGNVVPRGGDIVFDVYTSADARDWQLHVTAADFAFIAASSSYVIGFPRVTTRFLKVVTFGVNSIDTRVTELEVFSHVAFQASEERVTQNVVDSVQVGFSYAPIARLRLAYTGLFNLGLVRGDSGGDFTNLDWVQSTMLTVRLLRWLEAQASGENRRATQSGNLLGGWNTLTAQLAATPTATFTATARVTHLMAVEASSNSHNDEARLGFYVRFLPSLDSSVDLGYGRQVWEPPLDRQIDRTYVSWVGNAQLYRSLRLTGNVGLQRAVAKDGTEDPLAGKDYRGYGEASWRASQQLLFAVRLGWAEGTAASGMIQRYRVDWHPFPGGALVIGFSFDEDQQSTTGYRSRRVAFFPSWTVNRHASLNLNYTRIELTGPEGKRRNELLFVFLMLNT